MLILLEEKVDFGYVFIHGLEDEPGIKHGKKGNLSCTIKLFLTNHTWGYEPKHEFLSSDSSEKHNTSIIHSNLALALFQSLCITDIKPEQFCY